MLMNGDAGADEAEQRRIAEALAREARRRARPTAINRSFAMLGAALIVMGVAPWPAVWYWLGLIGVFIAVGWAQYLIATTRWFRDWMVYAFVAFDTALLVFTLVYPNPIDPADLPPQAALRFGNSVYLFIVTGALAMTLRPALILWGGVCGAAFWAAAIYWLASLPGSVTGFDEDASFAETFGNPTFVDMGIQLQFAAVFLIVSALVAAGSAAARRLVVRETAAARRAANLSRYLPAEAVFELAERDAPFGAEREAAAAVLFTDIVGFTALAERLGPKAAIGLLRKAQALVATAVAEERGVLDKFIGDGAMATFGAFPTLETEGRAPPAARALAAARRIAADAEAWSRAREARGEAAARLVVGLHYGPVLLGEVGAAQRMEFAVIGDTVNVASRLEHLCRALDLSVAISEEAMAAAGWPEGPERVGPEALRGRAEPVIVWGLAVPAGGGGAA
ncbi:MAG: adenylate/guanylate cyclase domain-containing protein [Pikeienuella sp.]|uniref:adenylate/guanylate cyclase domain-containing protein n=1 Tax=Pikeienuella sp. TaxID=2831957 RepID=UPI0039189F32